MKTEQEHTPERITIKFISTAGNYFIMDEEEREFISLDPNGAFAKELLNRYNCLAGISNPSEWVETAKKLMETDGGEKVRMILELRDALRQLTNETVKKHPHCHMPDDEQFYNAIDKAKQLLK